MFKVRKRYLIAATIVILLGVLSRLMPIGNILFDKYLGDALYAALLYLLLRIVWPRVVKSRIMKPHSAKRSHAIWAMLLVFAIELFQLTGIPLTLRQSGTPLFVVISIALGTTFSWLDVVAYVVGVFGIYRWDAWQVSSRTGE